MFGAAVEICAQISNEAGSQNLVKPFTAAPVILTPKPAPAPRINGPAVFGVRQGAPFLYSIPTTGDRPMVFSVKGSPAGILLNAATGRIAGKLTSPGEYQMTLRAENALGFFGEIFRIVVGEDIALTPPMGWNNYNSFGVRVSQDKALCAARAMVALGLDRHGWTYVNLDDGWQGNRGGPNNTIHADAERFRDIRAFVDEIHVLGLKAGLYHSPWTVTYGKRLGDSSKSLDGAWDPQANLKAKKNAKVLPFAIERHCFTYQDAAQFAGWRFDYFKYDGSPAEALETKKMHQALRLAGRDIVLSLSNNHIKNLFPVIGAVSPCAQSWRATTDISDQWSRVANDIGFALDAWAAYAGPGHFNDADVLVVGHVGGWKDELRPTRLTSGEQYTHISLWCLLSSPLLIGWDLEKMDEFTLSLLTNNEVSAVNQDELCKRATRIGGEGDARVYRKRVEDGSWAVGLFNLGRAPATVGVSWRALGVSGLRRARDLSRQCDLVELPNGFSADLASRGVVVIRVFPAKHTSAVC